MSNDRLKDRGRAETAWRTMVAEQGSHLVFQRADQHFFIETLQRHFFLLEFKNCPDDESTCRVALSVNGTRIRVAAHSGTDRCAQALCPKTAHCLWIHL
jgi:hypothetical protein